MRPTHDSVKRDQDSRDVRLYKDVKSLLEDLATESSTKGDLLIAAKVLRLAKSMNVFDDSMATFETIIKGSNKHKTDFAAKLEVE